jgi:hypothetical protein
MNTAAEHHTSEWHPRPHRPITTGWTSLDNMHSSARTVVSMDVSRIARSASRRTRSPRADAGSAERQIGMVRHL